MKVFITGDRSTDMNIGALAFAQLFPQLVLKQFATNLEAGTHDALAIYTGELAGFEAGVRLFCANAGVTADTLPSWSPFESHDEDAKPDFDYRHALLKDLDVDIVVFVHSDPMSSSIGRSLFALGLPDEKLVIVGAS